MFKIGNPKLKACHKIEDMSCIDLGVHVATAEARAKFDRDLSAEIAKENGYRRVDVNLSDLVFSE